MERKGQTKRRRRRQNVSVWKPSVKLRNEGRRNTEKWRKSVRR